jgi:hypothetical protein
MRCQQEKQERRLLGIVTLRRHVDRENVLRSLPEVIESSIVARGFSPKPTRERNMPKLLLVAFSSLFAVSAAMAQSKIDTKWHCSKPARDQKLDVDDVPDHIYWIGQGTCDATSNDGDLKEKSGRYTEFHDAWKATFTFHGYYNATTDDGDKVFYKYEGSGSPDPAKPIANKWKIVNGTGKYKGIKGSGSCAGKANADGSDDLTCTGTYSIASAKK